MGGDGVVRVGHRDGAETQQGVDGASRIEIPPALHGVIEGEEDLRDGDAVAFQRFLIGVRQANLPRRRRRLLFLELHGPTGKPKLGPADGDGARRHQHHVASTPAQFGDVLGQGGDPVMADRALGLIGEERGADLDHQPLGRAEPVGRRPRRLGFAVHGRSLI